MWVLESRLSTGFLLWACGVVAACLVAVFCLLVLLQM